MQSYPWHAAALVSCMLLCEGEAHTGGSKNFASQALGSGAGLTTSVSYGAELLQIKAFETDDRRFWTQLWVAVSGELRQLQTAAADGVAASGSAKRFASLAKLGNGSAALGEKRRHSRIPTHLNLDPKVPSDLVPALAMLKGLYEDGKQRITELNAREKKYKEAFAERQTKHDARMADIAHQKLSDGFKANETKDENRLFNYWQRVRERQHRQFHTSLKIQHGTLKKVKTMIDMYDKAIAGKGNRAEAKEQIAQVAGGAVPEVVLLQKAWHATAHYCKTALAEAQVAEFDAAAIIDAAPARLRR